MPKNLGSSVETGKTALLDHGAAAGLLTHMTAPARVGRQRDPLSNLSLQRGHGNAPVLVVDADRGNLGPLGQPLYHALHLFLAVQQHAIVGRALDQAAVTADVRPDKPQKVLLRGSETNDGLRREDRPHGEK